MKRDREVKKKDGELQSVREADRGGGRDHNLRQMEAGGRSDGVGADTDSSCGMRMKTGSDTLQQSPLLSYGSKCLLARINRF